MPKKELPRKIIKQENLWPTPYWYTQIWDFMRSETRVTFNEDFTSWINGEMKKETVVKSNRGGWQSELYDSKNDMFEPLIKQIRDFCGHLPLNIKEIIIPQLWANVNKKGNWNIIMYTILMICSFICWLTDQFLCGMFPTINFHALWHVGTALAILFGFLSL